MAALTVIVAIVRDDILESPIFLYRSRNDDFHYVITQIAQSNGRRSYDEIRIPFLIREDSNEEQKTYGFKDIFVGEYFKITMILSIGFSIFTFALYGILFFEPSLLKSLVPDEQYYIQFTDQAFGICGLIASVYLVDSCLGRKYTLIIGCVGTSIFCMVLVLYT